MRKYVHEAGQVDKLSPGRKVPEEEPVISTSHSRGERGAVWTGDVCARPMRGIGALDVRGRNAFRAGDELR